MSDTLGLLQKEKEKKKQQYGQKAGVLLNYGVLSQELWHPYVITDQTYNTSSVELFHGDLLDKPVVFCALCSWMLYEKNISGILCDY